MVNKNSREGQNLCLIKYDVMNKYGGVDDVTPHILVLCSRWRRVVSLTSRPFYHSGEVTGTYCTGDWVGPTDGLKGA
jgi:hypothetical protein